MFLGRAGFLSPNARNMGRCTGTSPLSVRWRTNTSGRTMNRRVPSLWNPNYRPLRKQAMNLDPRKLATVLAALRLWQREFDTPEEYLDAFPEHFEDYRPLDTDEIDELCERLNT